MEERNFSSGLPLICLVVGIFGLFYFLIKAHFRLQLVSFPQEPQKISTPSPTISPIEEKISQMSLEEKIGALFIVGFNGERLNQETINFFQKHHFNAFLLLKKNIKNREQLTKLINSVNQLKIQSFPPIIAVDQEGGKVNRIDFEDIDKTSQAEIKTPERAYQVAKNRGEVLASLGINLNFSPVVEVASKSSYIRNRAFHLEDGQKIASLAAQIVKGYQDSGIVSVTKHFPGSLGRTTTDPHKELPVLDIAQDELEKDIFPFKELIENSDIKAIMITHILYSQIEEERPSSLSEKFISAILRGDLGFDGLVISDDLAMGAITEHYSIAQAAKEAFFAGADLILISGSSSDQQEAYEMILQVVKDGEILEERIDQSLRRVLSLEVR